MKYFYLLATFFSVIFNANANLTLKQCFEKCHHKSLNLKDLKNCKDLCTQQVKQRKSIKQYHKNYKDQPTTVVPSVETTVRAATPEQAQAAAAAATGAAAGVLTANTPNTVVTQQQTVTETPMAVPTTEVGETTQVIH